MRQLPTLATPRQPTSRGQDAHQTKGDTGRNRYAGMEKVSEHSRPHQARGIWAQNQVVVRLEHKTLPQQHGGEVDASEPTENRDSDYRPASPGRPHFGRAPLERLTLALSRRRRQRQAMADFANRHGAGDRLKRVVRRLLTASVWRVETAQRTALLLRQSHRWHHPR